jgi:prophage antirepressor-like protein
MELIQKTFDFNIVGKQVRMVGTTDEPWFCGKDVATILGYNEPKCAITQHIDIEDKTPLKSILSGCDSCPTLNKNDLKTTYINESGLYSLILRSKLESAKKFKKWVTSEVLPSIRKSGQYKITQEIQELKDKINHANIVNKELLDFKLMKEKNETVYIMSSESYAKQGLWKIGKTKLKTTKRLSGLNTANPAGENIRVLKEIKTNNSLALEKRCHYILQNLRPTSHKEWFLSSWCNLVKLLDIISNNMNEELEIVNDLVKEVHSIDINLDKDKYIEGLDMNIFKPKKEIISITHEVTENDDTKSNTRTVIDVSGLSVEQMKEKLIIAINKFISENVEDMKDFDYNTEKDSDKKIKIVWKDILTNLMNICNIHSKPKIKANLWKPTARNILEEAKCLSSIKWK